MLVSVPRERADLERRVAATPASVERLGRLGFRVAVEHDAGLAAGFTDDAYRAAGAEVTANGWEGDVVVKVAPPTLEEASRLRDGQTLVSLVYPAQNPDLLATLAERRATVLALDQIPRISRAQKLDVLSSMANIAGYRAVVEAAHAFGRLFGGQITAAGRTEPAIVMVIGAGVAGLAAIAAAKGLGAVVRAFDVRPACKEQIESLGGEFLFLDLPLEEGSGGYAKEMGPEFLAAELDLFAAQCREVDIVITTALVPGKKAPVLITAEMLAVMKRGSVVVDLAAAQGGNCEGTVPGQAAVVGGVTVLGFTDLVSRLPNQASELFGTNVAHFLDDLGGDEFRLDLSDVVVRSSLVCHEGRVTWPPPAVSKPAEAKGPEPKVPAAQAPTAVATTAAVATTVATDAPNATDADALDDTELEASASTGSSAVVGTLAGLALVGALGVLGRYAPAEFLQHLTVFVLACFIGWQVVWNVTPALHTPLMSVTNAISGIIIVGGLLQASNGTLDLAAVLGAVAIGVASINIFGGFLVTQRMLQMFRKEG